MGQRAIVVVESAHGTVNQNEMTLSCNVSLLQEGVVDPAFVPMEILTAWADTLAQIKTKIINAVLTEAAARNYKQLTSTDIIISSFTKG